MTLDTAIAEMINSNLYPGIGKRLATLEETVSLCQELRINFCSGKNYLHCSLLELPQENEIAVEILVVKGDAFPNDFFARTVDRINYKDVTFFCHINCLTTKKAVRLCYGPVSSTILFELISNVELTENSPKCVEIKRGRSDQIGCFPVLSLSTAHIAAYLQNFLVHGITDPNESYDIQPALH